jgi:hypothetical protein
MSSASEPLGRDRAAAARQAPILRPYSDGDTPSARRRDLIILTSVTTFCLFYGLTFAFFAPFLLVAFAIPLAILGLILIWALPSQRTAPTPLLVGLFWAFLVGSVAWPNYLGLAIPGLPWITVARLTGTPMALVFLICLSVSEPFRARLAELLSAAPSLWKILLFFVFIQFYCIFMSTNVGLSLDKFITSQMSYTAMFFISIYVFAQPGRVFRWVAITWAMAIFVGVIGLWEHHLRHVPWVGHIPKFLQIQDPTVLALLQPTMRKYSDVYRVQSVFSGSIQLAEYIIYILPFIMHMGIVNRNFWVKVLAIVSMPFLFYIAYITNSRSGMVGFIVSFMLYPLCWGLLRWRRQPGSIVGPFTVLSYPVVAGLGGSAILVFGRLRALVLGSGVQQGSTEARIDQYRKGIPMLFKNPIGHGGGMAGDVLQWYTSGGNLTIDTYYLGVALEYGVLGFIVYYSIFLLAIGLIGRELLTKPSPNEEDTYLIPAAIALVNFVIIKGVFYQQDNHALVYMILGIVVALLYRSNKEEPEVAAPFTIRGRATVRR